MQTPEAVVWNEDEIARIDAAMGEIARKSAASKTLSELETDCQDALSDLLDAEAAARDAFAAFYAGLLTAEPTDTDPTAALPADVSTKVSRWVEARKRWDTFAHRLLQITPQSSLPVRHDRNAVGRIPALLRVPTALTARDALSALFAPHLWKVNESSTALTAQRGETHLQIDFDDALGWGQERAINQIAKNGASAAQTFLTLAAFWLEKCRDSPHETYLSVYASDLLRFQGRRETPRGGFHRGELLAKGRDIYLLSRISVPRSQTVVYENGERMVKTLSVSRLLSLETLDTAQFIGGEDDGKTLVRFRYHLGKEVYDWLGGESPQYTALSSRLLSYHPLRQKYQILLGFCLAYYDRVNRKNRDDSRRIGLPALLQMAAIEIPERRIGDFLITIEDALRELARDNVIPNVVLEKPSDWTDLIAKRRSRDVLTGSYVVFPRMLSAAKSVGQIEKAA